MFISFDGIDGAGKTTQIRQICEWLASSHRPYQLVRDPGTTPLGERLRAILTEARRSEDPDESAAVSIGARAETLLFMAARAQLVVEAIVPALERGEIVVADRYHLANLAYQGYGRGADLNALRSLGQFVAKEVWPDITFLLDLPADVAFARIDRQHDRMESAGVEFLERVRNGFLEEAKRYPGNVVTIDARRSPEEMQQAIRDILRESLA